MRTANATAWSGERSTAHLIGVAVDASLGVHNGVGTSNHLDQGPRHGGRYWRARCRRSMTVPPWMFIGLMDLIRVFSDGDNPIHDVVQSIELRS